MWLRYRFSFPSTASQDTQNFLVACRLYLKMIKALCDWTHVVSVAGRLFLESIARLVPAVEEVVVAPTT
jgi:hypothetical protein